MATSANFKRPGGGVAASIPLMGRAEEPTIFDLSVAKRRASSLRSSGVDQVDPRTVLPATMLRDEPPALPEVSERDLVGHFTRLSARQYSVDLGAYPLGSCTMKYNPKFADAVAAMPGISQVHPHTPVSFAQGWLEIMVTLESWICEITGMAAATLQPAAGAAGELTGLLIMAHYHQRHGGRRSKVIIPDSAHGTNPASVTLAGYEAVTVPSNDRGLVDLEQLDKVLGEDVAGMMLTNPNTLGLFEEEIAEITARVHAVGGLMYYDGANLNAILGVSRPGDMGFDIVHSNLHKTFATPHGGGGPGAGPVAVSERLREFLPGPRATLIDDEDGVRYVWKTPEFSIGRVHGFYGNAVVLARALAYMMYHGGPGLADVARYAVLNANWLRAQIAQHYEIAFPQLCMHEFVASAAQLKKRYGVRALDIAKGMIEEGFHSPTVYFPLVVDEALMMEPTETESPQTLRALADALMRLAEAATSSDGQEWLHNAPSTTPVGRVDEALAARKPRLTFDQASNRPV